MVANTGQSDSEDVKEVKTKKIKKPNEKFDGFVVAIGASAGGLDALERLFDQLPSNSGAVFVVVQHLSPDHKSMMDNLLARHTKMPVLMAENGMQILPNHVFLIPPGKNMTMAGNELRLVPKSPHGLSLPIDLFFTSLSNEFAHRSVGVILSGTGSDGTRGAVAINDAGGLLLAQTPESAKFDGMPRSIIATGLVDGVMPPEMLAARIVEHLSNAIKIPVKVNKPSKAKLASPMEDVLHLLHQVGGIDFNEYKRATVERRVERRMKVRHIIDIESYLRLLEGDRNEILTLRRDILISVTSFFRDSETFAILKNEVIAKIVKEHLSNQPIRVWVVGCSTGEEAYTLAILFYETFDQLGHWPQFKIFATDVEQHYIDVASTGVYSEAIVNELSEERLNRFFTRSGNQYVVNNEIRQSIVFARHNILDDPPFTRIDLVSCRNMLIYFELQAQEKTLLRFQYALAQNGFLLLGSSESLGSLHKEFGVVHSKHKIYRVLRPALLPLHFNSTVARNDRRLRFNQIKRDLTLRTESTITEIGQSYLLKQYSPPAMLVNEHRELLHVYGDVRRFMEIPTGSISLDISKLLIDKLAPVGVTLLHKVLRDKVQSSSDVEFIDSHSSEKLNVRLVVTPIICEIDTEKYYLIAFEVLANHQKRKGNSPELDFYDISNERIQILERELSSTQDTLQATIEELQTANEELQATNEELMASNEELQSTNEELQSVNEELYTVNAENQEKIEILNRANSDLDNMARAALIPTVFVNANLQITRFTSEACNIFNFCEGDVGRSLGDFTHELDYPDLKRDLLRVIGNAQIVDREIRGWNSVWYLVRILPYIDRPHNINGAVITFIDITQVKDAQRLQSILDSLSEHIAVLDAEGRITLVNKAWRDFAENNGDRGLSHTGPGVNYLETCQVRIGADVETANLARQGINRVLAGEIEYFSIKYPCHSPTEKRWFLMHVTPIKHHNIGAVVSHVNITPWVEGDNYGRIE